MCPIGSGIGTLVSDADREGLDDGALREEVSLWRWVWRDYSLKVLVPSL